MAIPVPPLPLDTAAAHRIAARVGPDSEQVMGVLTWAADEHLLMAAVGVFWLATRAIGRARDRRWADGVLLSTLAAAALPHVTKRLFNRRRPNRLVNRRRHGIPKQGKALDSFPSGHAMHVGALAAAATRKLEPRWWPAVWTAALAVSATRLGLLAHYPSDVVAGLVLGVLLDRGASRLVPVDAGTA